MTVEFWIQNAKAAPSWLDSRCWCN